MTNQTTCPVCAMLCALKDTRKVNRAINLAYECKGCGLHFTIATSAVAFDMAKRIEELEEKIHGKERI